LIGVNTAIYTSGGMGNVGIGFAIPVDTVRRVVNQIIRYGRVVRPTLGIHVSDDRVTRSIAMQLGRSQMDGVLVAEVFPGSPAEQAGLQATILRSDGSVILGDLITHVEQQPVKQVEDLLSAIEEKKAGDSVTLRVEKGCNPQRHVTVSTKLVARQTSTPISKQQQQRDFTSNRQSPASNPFLHHWQ
jgi:S1-C subfamily serine protease